MPIPSSMWNKVKSKDLIEVIDYSMDNATPPPQDLPVASIDELGVVSLAEEIEEGNERVATSNLVALALNGLNNYVHLFATLTRNSSSSGDLFILRTPFQEGLITYSQPSSNIVRLTFSKPYSSAPMVLFNYNGYVYSDSLIFPTTNIVTTEYINIYFRKNDGTVISLADIPSSYFVYIFVIGQ